MANEIQKYSLLLRQVKQRVVLAQQRAIYSANEELLRMYWDLGQMLYAAQHAEGWGNRTLARLSADLKNEYPKEKGFSERNFQFMIQFYQEYNQELTMVKVDESLIAKLAVSQLPGFNFTLPIRHIHWTHNVILMQRVKDIKARYWYMIQCLTSHWSKDFLAEAIKPTNDLIMWYVQNLHKPIVGQEATSSILKLIRKKVGATIQMSQNVRQLR